MMVSKRHLFRGRSNAGGLHADPEDRAPLGVHEPANQSDPWEAGAQRGTPHPGDPNIEIDLLDDGGGRRPGGWRSGIAIVTALSVFVGVLWYAYDWGVEQLGSTRLPLIVADTTPIKSRPEDAGGIEVLNQNVAVLNDAAPGPGEPQAERLLPPPEAPQMAPTELPQVAELPLETPQVASVAEVENLLGPPIDTAAGPPRKARAVEVPLPPAAPQVVAAPEPVLPEPKTEIEAAPEPPPELPVIPSAATSEPAPAAAPQVAALPAAETGGFVVQLAALRATDGARPAWTRLQKAHPALLGDRQLSVQQADLGDRGIFYRVRAGFFVARTDASDLCNALKARGQDCLVAKR